MSERVNPQTGRPYGQATHRQFIAMILTFITDRIVQPSFYILYWLTILALIAWGVIATFYGAAALCRAM